MDKEKTRGVGDGEGGACSLRGEIDAVWVMERRSWR